MEFITDSNELRRRFSNLCCSYQHYKWAVAWAGDVNANGFELADILKNNESKIDKIVIGLHFYQTAPSFISQYMKNRAVKFVEQTDGTFHSKVYLFYNSNTDWAAIVGSSNFTKYGFYHNVEANIFFNYEDGDVDMFNDISSFVDGIWSKGLYFSANDLKAYIDSFKYQEKNIKSLGSLTGKNHESIPSSIDIKSLSDYSAEIIRQDSLKTYCERVRLLEHAQKLFAKFIHFDDMPLNTCQCLAGYTSSMDDYHGDPIDWKLFGSMQGAGIYKKAINNKVKIGKAIDLIPLSGPISKSQFDSYCAAFEGWTNPLACATRLLAIKRPDWFVCIDSKNRRALSKMMNVPQSQITLQNYWEKVIQRIQKCSWYCDEPDNESSMETDIWKYRVAMLDCLCYKDD